MVVTSSKYDFFENGYAFYESSIMDFTSALISDRLYLQTEDMAKKDGLTKIYNRIYFNQFYPELKEEVAKSGDTFTVCMLDIDHFKRVNDTYGHNAGDDVLATVASILEGACGKAEAVYRWGGEEFIMMMPDTSLEGSVAKAEKIREKIMNTEIEADGNTLNVTMSFGCRQFDPELSIEDNISKADEHLYTAKETGRNRVIS